MIGFSPSRERIYEACRACRNTIMVYHCGSPTCAWCERCGNKVKNVAYEQIIYGEWSSGDEGKR